MSYDLAFWKQRPTCTASPSQIHGELLDGRAVDGLETIPTDEFVARVHQCFHGIVSEGGLTYWEGGERGMFELYSSGQHVHFCCRDMEGEEMNALIDIAAEFECPLYDPQVDTRFDGRVP